MTTKEAEKLEPFKPPFRVMAVRENGAAIGCVVTDFNRREISIVMPEHYAQWLCARLNTPSPTPEAEKLADAIDPRIQQSRSRKHWYPPAEETLIAASDYIRQTLKVKP